MEIPTWESDHLARNYDAHLIVKIEDINKHIQKTHKLTQHRHRVDTTQCGHQSTTFFSRKGSRMEIPAWESDHLARNCHTHLFVKITDINKSTQKRTWINTKSPSRGHHTVWTPHSVLCGHHTVCCVDTTQCAVWTPHSALCGYHTVCCVDTTQVCCVDTTQCVGTKI